MEDYAQRFLQVPDKEGFWTELCDREQLYRTLFAQDRDNAELKNPHLLMVPVHAPAGGPAWSYTGPDPRQTNELLFKDAINSKTPGQPSVVQYDEFKKNWKIFTERQLSGLNWDHVFAAGGSVAACMSRLPKEYSTKKRREYFVNQYRESDIDLFIYGLDEEQASRKVVEIYERINDNIPYPAVCFRSKFAITIVSQYPYRHIQIVLRRYASPAEVLQGFDVDSVCCGYDGEKVWCLPRAHRAFVTGCNRIDLSRRSTTYEMRLAKYASRGFAVWVPRLQRARVDPQLYERPFDKLQGLSRLLVLEKLSTPEQRHQFRLRQRMAKMRPQYEKQGTFWNRMKRTFQTDQFLSERIEESGVDASDYSSVFLPWGPKWTAQAVQRLMFKKDMILNSPWYDSEKEVHTHPCFMGTAQEVLKDCCGHCPEYPPDIDEKDEFCFVHGAVRWLSVNPGRQQIGSFNPITEGDWESDAYLSIHAESLAAAANQNDVAAIEGILKDPAVSADLTDALGRTPLHVACFSGHTAAAAALLRHGASLTKTMANGRSALHIAAMYGHTETLRMLVLHGLTLLSAFQKDVKPTSAPAPAPCGPAKGKCSEEGDEEDEGNEDEDEDEDDEDRPRRKAPAKASAAPAKPAGEATGGEDAPAPPFDIELRDSDTHCTALQLAVFFGYVECAKALIQEGKGDPLATWDGGDQPQATMPHYYGQQQEFVLGRQPLVHILVKSSQPRLIPQIVALGAPLHAFNQQLETPLMSAVKASDREAIDVILKLCKPGDPALATMDETGTNLVMAAVQQGNPELALHLLRMNVPYEVTSALLDGLRHLCVQMRRNIHPTLQQALNPSGFGGGFGFGFNFGMPQPFGFGHKVPRGGARASSAPPTPPPLHPLSVAMSRYVQAVQAMTLKMPPLGAPKDAEPLPDSKIPTQWAELIRFFIGQKGASANTYSPQFATLLDEVENILEQWTEIEPVQNEVLKSHDKKIAYYTKLLDAMREDYARQAGTPLARGAPVPRIGYFELLSLHAAAVAERVQLLTNTSQSAIDRMRGGARTKQTCRMSTGGKAPRKQMGMKRAMQQGAVPEVEGVPMALVMNARHRMLVEMAEYLKQKGAKKFIDLPVDPTNESLFAFQKERRAQAEEQEIQRRAEKEAAEKTKALLVEKEESGCEGEEDEAAPESEYVYQFSVTPLNYQDPHIDTPPRIAMYERFFDAVVRNDLATVRMLTTPTTLPPVPGVSATPETPSLLGICLVSVRTAVHGYTPLHIACQLGHVDMVKLLLECSLRQYSPPDEVLEEQGKGKKKKNPLGGLGKGGPSRMPRLNNYDLVASAGFAPAAMADGMTSTYAKAGGPPVVSRTAPSEFFASVSQNRRPGFFTRGDKIPARITGLEDQALSGCSALHIAIANDNVPLLKALLEHIPEMEKAEHIAMKLGDKPPYFTQYITQPKLFDAACYANKFECAKYLLSIGGLDLPLPLKDLTSAAPKEKEAAAADKYKGLRIDGKEATNWFHEFHRPTEIQQRRREAGISLTALHSVLAFAVQDADVAIGQFRGARATRQKLERVLADPVAASEAPTTANKAFLAIAPPRDGLPEDGPSPATPSIEEMLAKARANEAKLYDDLRDIHRRTREAFAFLLGGTANTLMARFRINVLQQDYDVDDAQMRFSPLNEDASGMIPLDFVLQRGQQPCARTPFLFNLAATLLHEAEREGLHVLDSVLCHQQNAERIKRLVEIVRAKGGNPDKADAPPAEEGKSEAKPAKEEDEDEDEEDEGAGMDLEGPKAEDDTSLAFWVNQLRLFRQGVLTRPRPLDHAISADWGPMVRLLLHRGAPVDKPNPATGNIFHLAATSLCAGALKAIVQGFPTSPLAALAPGGPQALMTRLLKEPHPVSKQTPLMLAIGACAQMLSAFDALPGPGPLLPLSMPISAALLPAAQEKEEDILPPESGPAPSVDILDLVGPDPLIPSPGAAMSVGGFFGGAFPKHAAKARRAARRGGVEEVEDDEEEVDDGEMRKVAAFRDDPLFEFVWKALSDLMRHPLEGKKKGKLTLEMATRWMLCSKALRFFLDDGVDTPVPLGETRIPPHTPPQHAPAWLLCADQAGETLLHHAAKSHLHFVVRLCADYMVLRGDAKGTKKALSEAALVENNDGLSPLDYLATVLLEQPKQGPCTLRPLYCLLREMAADGGWKRKLIPGDKVQAHTDRAVASVRQQFEGGQRQMKRLF